MILSCNNFNKGIVEANKARQIVAPRSSTYKKTAPSPESQMSTQALQEKPF